MKIITAKGNLVGIERVVRVCEKRIEFNGETRDIFELAKSSDVAANGICIRLEVVGQIPFGGNPEIYIGNLKAEEVDTIIATLASQDFYDFSKYTYQDAETQEDVKLDGGESNPFSSELTLTMLSHNNFTDDARLFNQPISMGYNPFANHNNMAISNCAEDTSFCDDDTEGDDSEYN